MTEADVIILAGGKGERLRPVTSGTPKPLLPIAATSTLEVLLRSLGDQGFEHATLALSHLPEKVRHFVGNGRRFGLVVDYAIDPFPLSTAGPLKLLEPSTETILSINGDILTTLQYGDLLRQHNQSGATATIAIASHRQSLRYGVLETRGDLVSRFVEKPETEHLVSLGINAIASRALDLIEPGEAIDMPTFLNRLVDGGEEVRVYRTECPWLDIGQPEDLAQARSFVRTHFQAILPEEAVGIIPSGGESDVAEPTRELQAARVVTAPTRSRL